ncbi:hypothetical protein [Isoptericola rhizosphaerae]|uniref:hypothetical protein n=1 Tax=Isoptericola rhizosphaerae TaxID=3377837 RepID=UPI00383A5291
MPGERDRFRAALVREALVLGRRIAQGEDAGVVQQETTISETVLLNLHEDLGDTLRIKMLTQMDEANRGADWIWCAGGADGWFSFYVQAKKLKKGSYDIGYAGSRGRQIDNLINTARQAQVLPVHVLFNPLRSGVQYSTRGCVHYFERGADAFTVVPSVAARELLRATSSPLVSLDAMQDHAHPWSCLAGCPHDPQYWGNPSAGIGGPWDEFILDALPFAAHRDDIASVLLRQLTRQTLETLETLESYELDFHQRITLDLAVGAYSPEPPIWASSPTEALSRWMASYEDLRGDLPIPSTVVVQQFGEPRQLF